MLFRSHDSARQPTEWTHEPHGFGQTGRLALDHPTGSFGCLIARRETGAAGAHHESGEAFAQHGESRGNFVGSVGGESAFHNPKASRLEGGGQCFTRRVDTRAMHNAVAHGEDFGFEWRAHERRRYRMMTIPSVSCSCGSTRKPWPKARHHRRRFIGPDNLPSLARVMADGAELRTATDDRGYLHWMLAHLTAAPEFAWLARRPQDWRRRPDDWPETRYEAKAAVAGRCSTFFRFERRSRASIADRA